MKPLLKALDCYYAGNEKEFEIIWKHLLKMVKWYKYPIPTQALTLKDIQQECMIATWKSLETWQKEKGNFISFALSVIYNKMTDIGRKYNRKCNLHKSYEVYVKVFVNAEEINIIKLTTDALYKNLPDRTITSIVKALLEEEDRCYCYNRHSEWSTLHHVSDRLGISIAEIKKELIKHHKFITKIILGR